MTECPACETENPPNAGRCVSCGRRLVELPVGSVVSGRYEIRASVGSGGMGVVYQALDRVLEETVALKVVHPGLAATPELLRQLRWEIKLARRVTHRNVCRIHEYGEDGELRYISMEFVDGITLKQAVERQGALPEDDAYDIALQLCSGLQAIHDVGIIHRDLKATNIMRDSRGSIRLMDFGIARLLEDERTREDSDNIVGTPEYMSPEQVRGQRLDFRSDIYSLGVVLFEIFVGELPFAADNPMDVLVRQIVEPPPIGDRVPAPVSAVLRKALAKDPSARYATARGVAADLRGRGLGVRPEGQAPGPGAAVPPGGPSAPPAPVALPLEPPHFTASHMDATPSIPASLHEPLEAAIKRKIDALLPGLIDADEAVRWETAMSLCQIGPAASRALPSLERALSDPAAAVAEAAAEAIKIIRREPSAAASQHLPAEPPSSVQARPAVLHGFIEALRHADAFVRWSAIVALGEMGPAAGEALPGLVEALDDLDDSVRWAAAVSLGKLGGAAEPAVRSLAAALGDPSDNVLQRHAAAALGQLGPVARDAVPGLITALRAKELEVRDDVVRALVGIGPAAVPALLEALKDDDELIRFEAAHALTEIGISYRPREG